ncbi:MAG: D-glycerate dehydrogenase [Actinomycetaceae bacterium]|nr:D-glycerate dehydrogenase [Actinomycetaceae bacterium]
MGKVLVTAPQLPIALDMLEKHHQVIGGNSFMDRAQLASQIGDVDAILSTLSDPLDGEMLSLASSDLKIISQCAAGYNNIDMEVARKRNIAVTTTPGILHETTADLAFTLLLMVTRRAGTAERLVRARKPWRYDHTVMLGTDLRGKTLGIVGLGQIGEAMARRAAAFGMNIIYSARTPKDTAQIDRINPVTQPTRRVDTPELLETADMVSLHCPLTPQTRHLINADSLAAMKDSAFLINTARGACVDEKALVFALENGIIAGAGLDVYEDEPQVTPALLEMENVVLLPHIGSATVQTRAEMSVLSARNILAVLEGKAPLTPVK